MTYRLTAVKQGRQTHGRTHKMFFTHTVAWWKPKGAWKAYKAVIQILLNNDESPVYRELFD
jgi:hypothetical protein